jgi:hypothetical protein
MAGWGTNFLLSLLKLSAKKPSQIHMWSAEERKGYRIIAWWSTMSETIDVFSAISYLIFIYLFSLFSSCIAEVLEHEHTQYDDCPSLSPSTSISLPHLHLFCLHSFFFCLELDHDLLIKFKMCQPCFFKICFY